MKKVLLATCLTLVGAGASFAQTPPKAATSTEAYVKMCNNKQNMAEQNFCHGFGQGVYETYLISRHPKNAKPFICAGNSQKTRQEYIDGFGAWTAKNPQYNQMSAADTILRYLGESYPCKS
ncbi:hypothetical protein G3I67_06240 [Orrella sp. NBD-18]|uniref:Rap1a immunity protein domain-containing protein n=1 Tax=Sheuella amnicola TaxID=2707330 RepID=A0A6B2R1F4_9BURK|nr:Rap1a/Tai family immunity protein [Sheuella amnicola]NDY82827.1 hypothetical protein [Sheuella amnicola]